jgi:hypothetical protein
MPAAKLGLTKVAVQCYADPDALGWLKSPPSLRPKPLGATLNEHWIN